MGFGEAGITRLPSRTFRKGWSLFLGNFANVVGFNPANQQGGISIMWKKFVFVIVVFGIAAALSANAGTEIVRDYGGREVNTYAPPPPPPVYYPPPPVGVVVYPVPAFFGPRFRFVTVGRFDGRRFPSRFHHFH